MPKLNILLYEGDYEICDGAIHYLENLGYSVKGVSYPGHVMMYADKYVFDVAILEGDLSDLEAVVEEVKRKNSDARIFISTHSLGAQYGTTQ